MQQGSQASEIQIHPSPSVAWYYMVAKVYSGLVIDRSHSGWLGPSGWQQSFQESLASCHLFCWPTLEPLGRENTWYVGPCVNLPLCVRTPCAHACLQVHQ